MRDSLTQAVQAAIPSMALRVSVFIIIAFMLMILLVLLYFKMVEADKKNSGNGL